MKAVSPCKDCEKRTVGCHSTCEDYISFADAKRKENNEMKAEKQKYATRSWAYSPNKKYTKMLNLNRNYSA